MSVVRRVAPWCVVAWGLPFVAFAQATHDCPPGQIWDHAACIPDPMLATPAPVAPPVRTPPVATVPTAGGNAQSPQDCAPGQIWDHGACIPDPMLAEPTPGASPTLAPPSLRIDTPTDQLPFDVTVTLADGTTQHCTANVTRGHPCILEGLPTGHTRVVVRGTEAFTRDVELAPGRQRVTLTHTAAANGVLPGALVVVASLLLGGGAAWMFAVCVDHGSCGDEVITGVAVPMALASGAGLIIGGGMLFWHRPAQNSVQVGPDMDTAMARVTTPTVAFGAMPTNHGGGTVTLGVTF